MLTKNEMARVIVTALYNLPVIVRSDHHEVIRRATKGRVKSLAHQYEMARAAIASGPHAHLLEDLP